MLDVELNNVTLNYGFKNILSGASFQINSGDTVAIVGDNGTGKTSMFNLISGTENPTGGTGSRRTDTTIGFLRQIAPEAQSGIMVRDFLRTAYREVAEVQKKMHELEIAMADPNLTTTELDRIMDAYSRAIEYFSTHEGYEVESNIEKMAGALKISEIGLKRSLGDIRNLLFLYLMTDTSWTKR